MDNKTPPYKAPNKPLDEYTSEERQAWLANHFATMAERQKRSDDFGVTAVICLGLGLIVPIAAIALAPLIQKFTH